MRLYVLFLVFAVVWVFTHAGKFPQVAFLDDAQASFEKVAKANHCPLNFNLGSNPKGAQNGFYWKEIDWTPLDKVALPKTIATKTGWACNVHLPEVTADRAVFSGDISVVNGRTIFAGIDPRGSCSTEREGDFITIRCSYEDSAP